MISKIEFSKYHTFLKCHLIWYNETPQETTVDFRVDY